MTTSRIVCSPPAGLSAVRTDDLPQPARRDVEHVLRAGVVYVWSDQFRCRAAAAELVCDLPPRPKPAEAGPRAFRAMHYARWKCALAARALRRDLALIGELAHWATAAQRQRAALVTAHLTLCSTVAARFRDRAELSGAAMLGLLRAVDRYDADRGFAFTSYAWRSITAACAEASRGRRPEQIDSPETTVYALPADSPAERIDAAERAMIGLRELGRISAAVDGLPPAERAVIEGRYGLVTGETQALTKLADELRLSPWAVRKLHAASLERLRLRLGPPA